MFGRMARAFATGDPVAFAEARANAAGLLDAAQESIREPSDARADASLEASCAKPWLAGGRIHWSP